MRQRFNRKDDDDNKKNRNELFGFRRATKNAARKVLPTKWFGTKEEKEALTRKQQVKDRVQGELGEMLKGAPLPIRMFGKYVAAPLMGKIASGVAEAGRQQQETIEGILDEALQLLVNDPDIVDLLGTPIQIGTPFSQMSSTMVINGRRQMRTEFAVEVSGPLRNGVSRIVATDEGISTLLVESNGTLYNVNLTSSGKMSSSSPRSRKKPPAPRSGGPSFGEDDNFIEAEIINKETK
jgi:hypothetical protein